MQDQPSLNGCYEKSQILQPLTIIFLIQKFNIQRLTGSLLGFFWGANCQNYKGYKYINYSWPVFISLNALIVKLLLPAL